MILSVVIITHNEEANLGRTLESVSTLVANGEGEIIVVDSGSTDRTTDIAKSFGAKVFVEEWKGFAAQKNWAIDKAAGDWILSLDADEEVSKQLADETSQVLAGYGSTRDTPGAPIGYWCSRKNFFLGRWIKRGGFWPDLKLRLFRRGTGRFEDRAVHEDLRVQGQTATLDGALLHHSYPTLTDYIDHMNRYSSLGAEMVVARGAPGFSVLDILVRPLATFIYNYIFRVGFLDGREGLLLHLYHAIYVSWKYAKAWELSRASR